MVTFFDFPREIRDQIYEFNLVHGTIPIGSTQPVFQASYGQIVHEFKPWPPDPCYCENCITNLDPRFEPPTRRNITRSVRDDFEAALFENTDGTPIRKSAQRSYSQPEVNNSGFAEGFRQDLVIFDSQNLSILRANHQIYEEASEIFYSRNKFDFGWINSNGRYFDSLVNASSFLQDRSEHALRHLKSIRFALRDYLIDEIWYKSSQFITLCETLAKKCTLTELDVGIFQSMIYPGYPGPHPCLEQLTKIKNLSHLHIWMQEHTDKREDKMKELEKSALATIRIFRNQSLRDHDKMDEKTTIVLGHYGKVTVSTEKAKWETERNVGPWLIM